MTTQRNWHKRTHALLKRALKTKTIYQIAKESGLSFQWLRKWDIYKDPGVNKVQKLYDYLTDPLR